MTENAESRARIHCESVRKLNFACHQNSFAVLKDLRIENLDAAATLENLEVILESDPSFVKPKTWRVDRIEPEGIVPIRLRDLELNGQFFVGLSEAIAGTLTIRVQQDGQQLAEFTQPMELLATNEWGGAGYMPELLPAFCMPNDPAVDQVIHSASKILRRAGKPEAIDGYQSGSRQRVWEIAGAIYSAVANLGITYAIPPASFENDGQKVRLPSQILTGRVATCLDTALLLAAAFEQAGLNSIIVLVKDHALVGVWLQPEKLASVTNDEAEVLRKRYQLKELLLMESTLATSHPAPPFSRAVQRAVDFLDPDRDADFVTAVDVARARAHQISPLGLRARTGEATTDTEERADVELALEEAPALPDFDQEVETQKPETPAGRLERWHRKLLDLSARNPMLNFRSTKSSVSILCPKPGLLEDKLAAGSRITVMPVPEPTTQGQDHDLFRQRTGDQLDEVYALDALEQRQVLVNLPKDELDKRLVEIYRKAQTSLQEGGANTLYLALGFLLWKRDSKDQRRFRAPLILMPVTLQRQSVRSGVKMLAHDDEPRFNTTLLEMLRRDFAIDIAGLDGSLPEDESGIDVAGIWEKVRRAVVDSQGFEVIEDVVLGHFSFAKYLMWKDLVDRTDDLRENRVVKHLLDTPRDPYLSDVTFVRPDELDQSYRPADFLVPLPADSSQMAVVASADRGKDFVVIGPPGTGKSQTISNLIAHLLGTGKTVLFVSEKTAALNVVYRRLEELGLGRFCLELHSNKARKADVLDQLKEAWNAGLARTEEAWEREAQRLEELRDALNNLVDRLHRKHANGLTAHYAIGLKVRDELLAERIRFAWKTADQHSETKLDRMREIARLLQVQAKAVGDVSESPFQLISHGEWSPTWEREILGRAVRLAKSTQQAESASQALGQAIGIDFGELTFDRFEALDNFSKVLRQAYCTQAAHALEPDGQDRIEALEQAVQHLRAYIDAQGRLSCPYDAMAWRKLDGDALRQRWQDVEQAWFLKRLFKAHGIRRDMKAGGAKGKPDPSIDAAALSDLRKEGEAIDKLDGKLKSLRAWDAHASDPSIIEDLRDLSERVRVAVGRLAATPQELMEMRRKVRVLLEDGNDLLAPDAPVGLAADALSRAFESLVTACAEFEEWAGKSVREFFAERNSNLKDVLATAQSIAERHTELNSWCGWQRRRNEALDVDLGPLIEGIESGIVPASEIPETFEAAYCTWWSERILDEDKVLRVFSSVEHEDLIEQFRQVDTAYMRTTARYIAARLSAGLPTQGDVPRSSQWGLLKREITKRARHKPVRQLMQEAPEAVTKLAPCLMMSPISVAQYLPSDQSLFDVVIFDEASQITVWDAVGSIARGKQVIVAGDPKQMPPTNFFGRAEDDADGDIDYDGDLESILDELRSSNVPELTLNLHYRSRRESLIAYSNHQYYDNGLITFPAPEQPDCGVRLIRPEGFYDRGKSTTNEGEARAVVQAIVQRLTSNDPRIREQTIGVVTFNSHQQSLIQDLLDQERSANQEIEWAFSDDCVEPVFVKNLETVQGDERDVIFFSVTFGPDISGKVSMNFGPLNRQGGERRLNVAMTRARSEMLVYSTLHPDKIDLSRSNARAVADLKHFLEYAERGPEALGAAVHGSLGDFESPFESAVAAGLRAKGWTVHPQIGVSAYRVDLGVVHPDWPGVYVAGIECDGAMYHSSAYARERDKIRQAVLEGLGWTLFRVWSTDWWIDKSKALDILDQKLRERLIEDRAERVEALESKGEPDSDSQVDGHPEVERSSSGFSRVAAFAGEGTQAHTPSVHTADGEAGRRDVETHEPEGEPKTTAHAQKYVFAEVVIDTGAEQLGEMSPARLALPLSRIVEVEAPVHVEDLVRRITQAAGLQRAGARIQDVVHRAIDMMVSRGDVRRKGDFLWSKKKRSTTVRDRSDFASQEKKLERVAPEEIALAMLDTLRRNYSMSVDDTISDAARDLGFQRVTTSMGNRFSRILRALVEKGFVSRDGDLLSIQKT